MKFPLSLFMGLVATVTSASAAPVTYNINFTGIDFTGMGLLPTFGQFTYDATGTPGAEFSNFTVVWNSLTFDLTASANAPVTDGACTPPSGPATFSFLVGITPCTDNSPRTWFAYQSPIHIFALYSARLDASIRIFDTVPGKYPIAMGSGAFTVQVPEPSTMKFAITGFGGLVLVSWKRRRRPLATNTAETAKL